jgi:hypothetical protein
VGGIFSMGQAEDKSELKSVNRRAAFGKYLKQFHFLMRGRTDLWRSDYHRHNLVAVHVSLENL